MSTKNQIFPKYYQISRDIIANIQKGRLITGSQVPSENEIIEKYGVSNTTARKALQEIEHNGWVTRIKGKGTYVTNNKVERSVTRILGFTVNMNEAGREPSTRLIQLKTLENNHTLTINRRQYVLRGPLCMIHRIRFADDIPMMVEKRYISLQFCPDIQEKDLEKSLYEIYENYYGLQLSQVDQKLSAVMTEPEEISYFDLVKPVPAFRVEGVTFCGKELILEMENSLYRGDMYSFSVKAVR